MNEILNQLGQLFVQTIPTVIFVFLLLIVLERILFRPLKRVLAEREAATTGALAKAREQAAAAEAKAREYEEALMAARQEIYRQKDLVRNRTLEEREKSLKDAREQAEALLREAMDSIARETTRVQEELKAGCQSLAQEITELIFEDGRRETLRGGPTA
jgi:F-type H+-transporting ATPase subunit b